MDLYEQGRWSFTLNLIDHLPRTSAYAHAIAQDEELAEVMPEPTGSRQVPLTEWSPEAELLAATFDRLADVVNAVVAGNGGKPKPAKPYPRPITASQRVRARQHRELSDQAVAKAFPNRAR